MKRRLLTLSAALLASVGAFAQLPAGSYASDWTLKDLNGNTHNLYSYLNAGKTVYFDISAAWCSPCWSLHNAHLLDSLWKNHGPIGQPGVLPTSTNDVMVFFIEGESQNSTAQLYGTGTGGSGANPVTDTKGDWVTGMNYPILDSAGAYMNQILNNYQLVGFPTLYMVCPERSAQEVDLFSGPDWPTQSEAYALKSTACLPYPASSTLNARAFASANDSRFYCTASPVVQFQNYSTTQTLTAATINVYSGATLQTSYNWTGSVAPYEVGTATIPAFTPTGAGPFTFEVVAAGDSQPSDNMSTGNLFSVYTAASVYPTPFTDNFTWSGGAPASYDFKQTANILQQTQGLYTGSTLTTPLIQADGTNGYAMLFNYYQNETGNAEIMLGNFNTAMMTNATLDFDMAYRQYTNESDKLEVMVSNDCGATWQTVYTKAGSTLMTLPADTNFFMPTAAAHWRHESVNLNANKGSNTFIKFKGTTAWGNNLFLDNINLNAVAAGLNQVMANTEIAIFPNPARESATVSLTLDKSTEVSILVMDAMGRTVQTINGGQAVAGKNTYTVATSGLAAGLYTIKVQTAEGFITRPMSVVK